MNNILTTHYNLSEFLTQTASKGRFAVVLGRPIKQSLSPLIHNTAFKHHKLDVTYYAVHVSEIEEQLFPTLFNHPNFVGANVTIPFKQKVGEYLDMLSNLVIATNACNTIYRNDDRLLCGDNTDVHGFQSPLNAFKSEIKNKDAIIFGSGGASKAAIKALTDMGVAGIYVVSRNPGATTQVGVQPVSYSDWPDLVPNTAIIINASPLGMYPNMHESPVLSDQVSALRGKICYDLVYRPIWTRFLEQAAGVGASCIDGVPMFIGQAAEAFKLFTSKQFPSELADHLVRKTLSEKLNS